MLDSSKDQGAAAGWSKVARPAEVVHGHSASGRCASGWLLSRWFSVLCLGLAVLVLLPQCCRAGAWTQLKGHTYSRSTISFYRADAYFSEDRDKLVGDFFSTGGEFSSKKFSQILEYGFTDEWTGIGVLELKSLDATGREGRTDDSVFGPGDLSLGLRRALLRGSVVAAIQGVVEIPAGYDADRQDYALGNGETNVEFRGQIGGGLSFHPSWWNLEAGYRIRGGRFSDDVVFGAALGVEVYPRFWARVGVSGVENQRKDGNSQIVDGVVVGDPSQSASYVSFGGALTYQVTPKIGVEISTAQDLAGENTFAGTGVDFSLEIRR